MKKALKLLKILLYLVTIYILTFAFIAFFIMSADVMESIQKSDSVTVTPEKIKIKGNARLKKKEILLITGLDKKKISWFKVDRQKVESYLISSGWVKKVSVTKHFPDSITIDVMEYKPSVIVNVIKKNNKEKNLYTMWFADMEGTVFKRAFPGETDTSLPFFHIDYDLMDSKRRKIEIKTAARIAELWKKSNLCSIRSISYDFSIGFSVYCEGAYTMSSVINFGKIESSAELEEMKERFFSVAYKLMKLNKWAGEYTFEKKGNKIRVVVGKVFRTINRGKNV